MSPAPAAHVASATAHLPVLFVDTCALLEIVRFAERERRNAFAQVDAARKILAAAIAPTPTLAVVTSQLVETEWIDNHASVLKQVEGHVADVENQLTRVVKSALWFGATTAPPMPSIAALSIPQALHDGAEALLRAAHLLRQTKAVEDAAFARELAGRGPARKGNKKCLKDCLIAETLLEFARARVAAKLPKPLVFLTYNHRDFSSGGSKPHADLESDFRQMAITLALDYSWAHHSLGI